MQVLFEGEDLSLLPNEVWWDAPAQPRKNATTQSIQAPPAQREGPETDSDDSDASSASLESLDNEEAGLPMDLDKKWRPVQLHSVLADLRQNEDTLKRVDALQKLEPLVRCVCLCSHAAAGAPEAAFLLL